MTPIAAVVGAVLAVTVIAIVWSTRTAEALLAVVAAMTALFALVLAGLRINRDAEADPATRARRYAGLMALAYAWGAAVMLAIHIAGSLRWYHYGQYGLAFAAIAAALLVYAHVLGRPGGGRLAMPQKLSIARALAVLQGAAALTAVGWLMASGKALSVRGDWAANLVFLAGGLAIAALSMIAAARRSASAG